MKSFALKSFKNREIGVYEAANKFLGNSMHEFSDAIQWLPAQPSEDRRRRLLPLKEVTKLQDHSEVVYHTKFNRRLLSE